MQLTPQDLEIIKALLQQRTGTPSELIDRVAEVNFALAQKLRSWDYDDLDRLFLQVFDSIAL